SNTALRSDWLRAVMQATVGIVDPPQLSLPTVKQLLPDAQWDIQQLAQADRDNSAVLLPDVFTYLYDAPVVVAAYQLLKQLGFQVWLSAPVASGKPLHVLGFLQAFEQIAARSHAYLSQIQAFDIPIVGIEPSIVLTYRDEYAQLGRALPVYLPQEFLLKQAERFSPAGAAETYTLLSHCTEKALVTAAPVQWQQVFAAAGLSLNLQAVGCCGMAGLYGYEAEHLEMSRSIYALSWEKQLRSLGQSQALATGFSCRAQVQRLSGWRPRHPLQVLQQAFVAPAGSSP
ncbi:MAG: (Fe-S)-binding protein, partial [Leptolyngbya sp. SIO4C1]|nr:(Fe-S)-binding protein [Leptolyngbya sp. SIO4C1]